MRMIHSLEGLCFFLKIIYPKNNLILIFLAKGNLDFHLDLGKSEMNVEKIMLEVAREGRGVELGGVGAVRQGSLITN